MIAILFSPGSFGSTLEYCLRNFSDELTKVVAQVQPDGSMHSFSKEFHPVTFESFIDNQSLQYEVITPIYPTLNYTTPIESIQRWKTLFPSNTQTIVMHFDSIEQYERNILFAFFKVPRYLDNILRDKAQIWNPDYTSFNDMQVWELREALSFYIDQVSNYSDFSQHIPDNFMKITPDDVLFNLPQTVKNMLKFCNLTLNDNNLENFYLTWREKQQYILDEFELVNNICNSIKNNSVLSWNKLSIVGEAIIQSRLRRWGIDLKCFNLVNFPNCTTELKSHFE